jgi:AcrR family transcriptional regulator
MSAGPGRENEKRKERALQRRSQRREQILLAAKKVFSLKGYHDCSVSDILEEAEIARGTFYLYFPSKRAVFEDLLDQMFAQITGAVRRIQLGPDVPSELEQMNGNVLRIIDVLESNRELTIILLREAVGLDADFDQKLSAFYGRLSAMIEGALRLGQSMGLIRECHLPLVSYCVLGSLKEVMLQRLTGKSPRALSREMLAQEILRFNFWGISSRESDQLPGRT